MNWEVVQAKHRQADHCTQTDNSRPGIHLPELMLLELKHYSPETEVLGQRQLRTAEGTHSEASQGRGSRVDTDIEARTARHFEIMAIAVRNPHGSIIIITMIYIPLLHTL